MISLLFGHLGGLVVSVVVAIIGGLIRKTMADASARQAIQDMALNFAGTLIQSGGVALTATIAENFLSYAKRTVGGSIERLGVTNDTLVNILDGKLGFMRLPHA